jgi:hypothetical protein
MEEFLEVMVSVPRPYNKGQWDKPASHESEVSSYHFRVLICIVRNCYQVMTESVIIICSYEL